jgi:hypothetical protein
MSAWSPPKKNLIVSGPIFLNINLAAGLIFINPIPKDLFQDQSDVVHSQLIG